MDMLLLILGFKFYLEHINDSTIFSETCEIVESDGFLKNVCPNTGGQAQYKMYQCPHSEEIYTDLWIMGFMSFFDKACPNDPKHYQMCGIMHSYTTNNADVLCGLYTCGLPEPDQYDGFQAMPSNYLVYKNQECDGVYDCTNTDLDEANCDGDMTTVVLPTGIATLSTNICNDVCDNKKCEDEAFCNGYNYKLRYVLYTVW